MNLTTQEIITALGETLVQQSGLNVNDVWTDWSTDSRQKVNKGLFIAITGETFDAHDFLIQAYENGAVGFVVSDVGFKNKKNQLSERVSVFVVKDTIDALQRLAHASSMKLNCLKVAITGTSGKTSVKYFCHQMLEGFVPHYFSPKSFNNHIGVPFTLLNLQKEHQVGLIEIGMNRPGEIASLVKLAKPQVCVVTMVGRGHLEGVGSIEAVLKEKISLYQEGQTHIMNIDDPRIFNEYKKIYHSKMNTQDSIIKVSLKDKSADVYFNVIRSEFNSFEIEGHIRNQSGRAKIPIAGEHHALNVSLASSICLVAGMKPNQIWSQMEKIAPVWGRSEILKSKNEVSIYFDAYNANPESMKVFLHQTTHLPHPPFFILGEMLEMGEYASDVHFELGQLVAKTPHQKVWFIGPSSESFRNGYVSLKNDNNLMISNSYEQTLALDYQSMLQPGDWVGLKASRGIGLEKFLAGFVL